MKYTPLLLVFLLGGCIPPQTKVSFQKIQVICTQKGAERECFVAIAALQTGIVVDRGSVFTLKKRCGFQVKVTWKTKVPPQSVIDKILTQNNCP